jgi:DNA polymerase-1
MLEIDRWLASSAVEGRLIMQVHDELVLEVRDSQAPAVAAAVAALMEGAADLAVPLKVDTGIGDNWDEAH